MLSPGLLALLQAAVGGASAPVFSGTLPSAITGLSGWWDGGALTDILDSSGNVIPDWTGTTTIGTLRDKSGNSRPMSPSASGAVAVPRLSGGFGGVSMPTSFLDPYQAPLWFPLLDANFTWSIPSMPFGSGQAWTRYFVWSRPNFRQYGWTGSAATDTDLTTPVTLLTQGSNVILSASPGATGNLTLFPGASQTVLTSALTRRHTHNIIIRNTPGTGVDVWLDGVQVATAAANPFASTATGTLTLLGAASGTDPSAQCYFHEMATWERALSSADITTLVSCASRWFCGARKGVNIIVNGQSNASNWFAAGANVTLQNAIRYYLSALSCNVTQGPPNAQFTISSGTGLYTPLGEFLHDPGDGSNPSTWSFGSNMANAVTWLGGMAPYDQADLAGILWLWNENDSQWSYSNKARYTAALKRFVALERALCGQTAATMPLMFWNPIPYGNDQMLREVFADVVADGTQNASIVMPMTADSNANGATAGTPAGTWTGGDNAHRDYTDHVIFARRGALATSRALLAASHGDVTAIPGTLPAVGGPKIVSAHKANATTIVVTVQHDQGTDLLLPGLASTGLGLWTVMDGGSVASPGALVTVTSVVKTDSTHLTLTLSQALTQSTGALYYPWDAQAYSLRGDGVTDNYSTIAKPAGWDIGADLGSSYTINYPLQATTYGIPLT